VAVAAAVLVAGAALAVRVALLERQSLWVDEAFSLAMATGHSLEHPAGRADPARGDFVEAPAAQPVAAYRRYAEHEDPPAGVTRVVRAVLLSDTSPPLYYLLLYAWTLAWGTGDAALRGFSLLWSLLSLPLAWSLGAAIGGRRAALPSLALFALAPFGVYFTTEGRMYSLLVFLVMATALLVVRLHRRGARPWELALWVAASAAGLLTHYFFVFPWAAMTAWLLARPGRLDRRALLAAAGGVCLLALPWYTQVPASLRSWRVSQGWLNVRPAYHQGPLAPLVLLLRFISRRGLWSGDTRMDYEALFLGAIALVGLVRRRGPRAAVAGARGLAWLWLAAACLGPLVFDALRGTYAGQEERYALAGLPAATLLLAAGIASLPRRGIVVLGIVLLLWTPGLWANVTRSARVGVPIREAARSLAGRAGPEDVVLVHSLPSGIVGMARYLDGRAPMAAWVGQLGQRKVPDDVVRLAAGRRRLFLVLFFTLGEVPPELGYLERNARLVAEARIGGIWILELAPAAGERFPPAP
jgi:hypothetical protein